MMTDAFRQMKQRAHGVEEDGFEHKEN
jgi:hypothetical protein